MSQQISGIAPNANARSLKNYCFKEELEQMSTKSSMVPSSGGWVERQFRLKENKTDVRTEVMAGITTFMTMAYILFVNPSILAETGMPFDAVDGNGLLGHSSNRAHGILGQLSLCSGPRDGLKCLFHLFCCLWYGLYLADCFGSSVDFGYRFRIAFSLWYPGDDY